MLQENIKKVYCIVGNANINFDKVRLRRERLAQFLLKRSDTEAIVWIYPKVNSANKVSVLKNFIYGPVEVTKTQNNRFISIALPSNPFFFIMSEYCGLWKTIMFKNVFETISNIIESYSGKKVLLYTKPSYSFFSHFPFWDLVAYDCSDLWSSSMTDATTWINNMNHICPKRLKK